MGVGLSRSTCSTSMDEMAVRRAHDQLTNRLDAVDQPPVMQCDEGVLDGSTEVVVHREGLPSTSRLRRPVVCICSLMRSPLTAFHFHTSAMKASRPRSWRLCPLSLLQLLLHHHLRGDARVVSAGEPQRRLGPACAASGRWRPRLEQVRAWPRWRVPVTLGGGMTIDEGRIGGGIDGGGGEGVTPGTVEALVAPPGVPAGLDLRGVVGVGHGGGEVLGGVGGEDGTETWRAEEEDEREE